MGQFIFAIILIVAAIICCLVRGNYKKKIAAFKPNGYSDPTSDWRSVVKGMGITSAILFFGAALLFGFSFLVSIPAGHVGVITTFGEVEDILLHEGLNVKAPWQDVHIMSIREQVVHHTMNAASSKGIMIDLNMDIVYQLRPESAIDIYQTIGDDYYPILVEPLINRTAKDVMVNYMAEDMYTGMRPMVNTEIEQALIRECDAVGIQLLRAPIINMEIPSELKAALETRQVEEYNVQTAQQRLEQERVEAERKRVEAEGIRDFQQTVAQGINNDLLYWKYIEVMGLLADSPNNTFIIIPTDVMANFPF